MSTEPNPVSKFRRTWVALLAGVAGLTLLFFISVVLESYLIAAANLPAGSEPRSTAGGWASSGVWWASVGACSGTLFVIGYIAKRLSPPGSAFAVLALLVLVFVYVVFAQFPATQSTTKIVTWSVSLPVSLAFGAWIASRRQDAV